MVLYLSTYGIENGGLLIDIYEHQIKMGYIPHMIIINLDDVSADLFLQNSLFFIFHRNLRVQLVLLSIFFEYNCPKTLFTCVYSNKSRTNCHLFICKRRECTTTCFLINTRYRTYNLQILFRDDGGSISSVQLVVMILYLVQ